MFAEPPALRLALALGDQELEQRLRPALDAAADFEVVVQCLAADQLQEVVHTRQVDAVVVAWGLHRLSESVLTQLERGRVPLLLLAPDPESERWQSRQAVVLPMQVEPAALCEAIQAVARGERPLAARPTSALEAAQTRSAEPPDPEQLTVVAVAGGAGSPGRTTVAINLATALGAVEPTVLIDADVASPSVAAYLDRDPSRNLCTLAHAVRESPHVWGRALEDELQPLHACSRAGVVLCGLPKRELRASVSAAALERLVAELRVRYRYVVLDVGAELLGLEAVPTLHRSALQLAQHVLLVTAPDLVGLWHARTVLGQLERQVDIRAGSHQPGRQPPRRSTSPHACGDRMASRLSVRRGGPARLHGPAARGGRAVPRRRRSRQSGRAGIARAGRTPAQGSHSLARAPGSWRVARCAVTPDARRPIGGRPVASWSNVVVDHAPASTARTIRSVAPTDRAAERIIRDRVADVVSRSLGDGHMLALSGQDEQRVRVIIDDEVASYERRAVTTNSPLLLDPDGLKRRLLDGVFGLGILQPLMDDPRVEEIIVNGPLRIFAIRDGRKEPVSDAYFENDDELRQLVKRVVGAAGRRLDEAAPMVDVRLPDGSRLNAVIPPAATRWTSLTIRKFAMRVHSLRAAGRAGRAARGSRRVPGCGGSGRRQHPGQRPDRLRQDHPVERAGRLDRRARRTGGDRRRGA